MGVTLHNLVSFGVDYVHVNLLPKRVCKADISSISPSLLALMKS